MSRPSETLTAAVGSILGAGFIVLRYVLGAEIPPDLKDAAIILVSWLAAGVTYLVARRQRAGEMHSGRDGRVG